MRRFYRTTLPDNTGEWLVPVLEPSEDVDGNMRNVLVTASGSDGAFDLYGDRRAPRQPFTIPLSFVLGEDSADDLQAAIAALHEGVGNGVRSAGRRKLWSREADETAPRWVTVKLAKLPRLQKRRENILHQPVDIDFLAPDSAFYDPISPDWLADNYYTAQAVDSDKVGEPIAPDLTFARIDITSSPYEFDLINDGPLETRLLIFRLESQAAAGFTNPTIANVTSGQSFSSTTDGADANAVLSVNCSAGLGRARISDDGGVSWTDDTLNLSLGVTQAVIMELLPGTNTIRYTDGGTPNLHLLCWWASAWRD